MMEERKNAMPEDEGEMSVREAGKKGGEETARTHGHEFYEEIGQKGGERTKESHNREFYEEIGHEGGRKVKRLIEEGKDAEDEDM